MGKNLLCPVKIEQSSMSLTRDQNSTALNDIQPQCVRIYNYCMFQDIPDF